MIGKRSLNLTKLTTILLFWFVLVPMNFYYRILGKKLVNQAWKSDEESYWEQCKASDDKKAHFESQF